ncbi:hypothetical protein [Cucumibacter marinus]|uniref:hypothetical protein n=1 Tax=Cucumibacter marinus TaxID=1121252 RepID=UPI000423B619|nr:hypothetical protein [Cucumibacter marinus]
MDVQQTNDADLTLVGPKDRFPKVTLMEPVASGYVLLAAEIDHRPPVGYFIESARKKRAIEIAKAFASEIVSLPDVREAVAFKTLIAPPGRGELLKRRPNVDVAKYDLVLLIECETPEAAQALKAGERFGELLKQIEALSEKTLVLAARNARRIGPVDHSRDGVFLFNYFYADSLQQNLGIWEYTAGWFEDQTGLDNSTLMLPEPGSETDFTIINHCRWNGLLDIMPSLIFKPSFRSFVLDNFEANDTAASPILYRLA